MNVYGYCPQCGAPGFTRERRLNGDDICERGHRYPSNTAIKERSYLGNWRNKISNTEIEVVADYRGFLLVGIISRPQAEPSLLHKDDFINFYERV